MPAQQVLLQPDIQERDGKRACALMHSLASQAAAVGGGKGNSTLGRCVVVALANLEESPVVRKARFLVPSL